MLYTFSPRQRTEARHTQTVHWRTYRACSWSYVALARRCGDWLAVQVVQIRTELGHAACRHTGLALLRHRRSPVAGPQSQGIDAGFRLPFVVRYLDKS